MASQRISNLVNFLWGVRRFKLPHPQRYHEHWKRVFLAKSTTTSSASKIMKNNISLLCFWHEVPPHIKTPQATGIQPPALLWVEKWNFSIACENVVTHWQVGEWRDKLYFWAVRVLARHIRREKFSEHHFLDPQKLREKWCQSAPVCGTSMTILRSSET